MSGHYCPTPNCQWQYGYAGCTLYEQVAQMDENEKLVTPFFSSSEHYDDHMDDDVLDWLEPKETP